MRCDPFVYAVSCGALMSGAVVYEWRIKVSFFQRLILLAIRIVFIAIAGKLNAA